MLFVPLTSHPEVSGMLLVIFMPDSAANPPPRRRLPSGQGTLAEPLFPAGMLIWDGTCSMEGASVEFSDTEAVIVSVGLVAPVEFSDSVAVIVSVGLNAPVSV